MNQRLFKLMYYLIENSSSTASELAHKFEVSTRTIYRDIDALSLAGIPVYTEQGKGGGIYIMDDFVLDKTLFSQNERQHLVSYFQTLSLLGTPDTEELKSKLTAVFGEGDSWLDVDFSPWSGGEELENIFRIVKSSVINKTQIKFDYIGSYGQHTNRTINPLKMVFKSYGWYIYGYCLIKNDYRFFKLTRMQNVISTSIEFNTENYAINTKVKMDVPELKEIKMLFKPESAYRIYDEFSHGNIQKQTDGNLLVTLNIPDDNWIVGYILSFGDSAKIISPESIKEKVKSTIKALNEMYQ